MQTGIRQTLAENKCETGCPGGLLPRDPCGFAFPALAGVPRDQYITGVMIAPMCIKIKTFSRKTGEEMRIFSVLCKKRGFFSAVLRRTDFFAMIDATLIYFYL